MSVGKGLLLAWKYAQEGKDEDAARALVKVGFGSIGLGQGVRNTLALGNLLRKEGLVGLWRKLKACFAAGTKLWTPEGPRAIETLREGDLVLSRDENDPNGAVVARRVEMTFKRLGRILVLRVGGQEIRTTAEHPFWVWGKGWTEASALRAGDRLALLGEGEREVEAVEDGQTHETVYNLSVEDHTYFVGGLEWGFALYSHNADCLPINYPANHDSPGTPGVAHNPTMCQIAINHQAEATRHSQLPAGVNRARTQVRTNKAPLNPAYPDGPPP